MKKEIIVFDKDGTLLDFDAFWVSQTIAAIKEVLKAVEKEEADLEAILKAFGVENGVTDIDGVLCHGTYEEIGLVLYEILKENGETRSADEIVSLFNDACKNNVDKGVVLPTCENIKEVLTRLKEEGRTLLIVTTDNYETTYRCLDALGIKDYFEKIYADDGITPTKPDPTCIVEYLKAVGSSAEKAVMIGDTMNDIGFARNAGMHVIGVAKTEKTRARLAPYADFVIPDISTVCDVIKELEKE